jgi:hypothetical protein
LRSDEEFMLSLIDAYKPVVDAARAVATEGVSFLAAVEDNEVLHAAGEELLLGLLQRSFKALDALEEVERGE